MIKNILSVLLAALVVLGCSKKDEKDEKVETTEVKPYKVGDIITLKGVEGGERKLKRVKGGFEIVDNKDKILILDFFGTFCPPCKQEAPELTEFQIKYSKSVSLIGLTYFEDVKDGYVVENFSNKYNAHYFISNNKQTNKRLAASVIEDIKYPQALQLPFKVVIKDGKYQILKDVWYNKSDTKFYIGAVGVNNIKEDIDKILKK